MSITAPQLPISSVFILHLTFHFPLLFSPCFPTSFPFLSRPYFLPTTAHFGFLFGQRADILIGRGWCNTSKVKDVIFISCQQCHTSWWGTGRCWAVSEPEWAEQVVLKFFFFLCACPLIKPVRLIIWAPRYYSWEKRLTVTGRHHPPHINL